MPVKGRRAAGELNLPGLTKGSLETLAALPITAFVGFNGSGKTACAVQLAITHLEAGRKVLSTVRLLDYNDPRPCDDDACTETDHGDAGHMAAHPLWVKFSDFAQLFDFRDGHVLMDEVTGVADAREHQGMPVQVRNLLPQLRRRGVTLSWTTIHWSFADVRLRRMTWAVVYAVGLMPVYAEGEVWGRNRLFFHRTFDVRSLPDTFDPTDKNARAKGGSEMRAILRTFMWGPKTKAFKAYSSGADVSSLSTLDAATGTCMDCGGKRRVPTCSCDAPARAPRARTAAQRGTDAGSPSAPAGTAGLSDAPHQHDHEHDHAPVG